MTRSLNLFVGMLLACLSFFTSNARAQSASNTNQASTWPTPVEFPRPEVRPAWDHTQTSREGYGTVVDSRAYWYFRTGPLPWKAGQIAQYFPPNSGFPDSLNFSAKFERVNYKGGAQPSCTAALSAVYSNGSSDVLFFFPGTVEDEREWKARVKTLSRMRSEEYFIILAVVQMEQDSLRCSVALDVTDFLSYYGIAVSAEDEVGPEGTRVGVPYPNPVQVSGYLQLPLPPGETATVHVYDVLGREIHRQDQVQSGDVRVSTEGWSPGTYFVQVAGAARAANDYARVVRRFVVR